MAVAARPGEQAGGQEEGAGPGSGVVKDSTPAPTGYVEMLAGGVIVRFDVGTDVDYVARLAAKLAQSR